MPQCRGTSRDPCPGARGSYAGVMGVRRKSVLPVLAVSVESRRVRLQRRFRADRRTADVVHRGRDGRDNSGTSPGDHRSSPATTAAPPATTTGPPANTQPSPPPTASATSTTTTAAPASNTFTILVAGDLLPHTSVIEMAKHYAGGQGYNFTPMFWAVRPIVAGRRPRHVPPRDARRAARHPTRRELPDVRRTGADRRRRSPPPASTGVRWPPTTPWTRARRASTPR